MPEHTSLESAKNNVVRHLWTEGPTHNNGIKRLLAPRYRVAGDIDADPSAPNQKNYSEYAKAVPVLICHRLGTHSLLKAFSSSKCDV